MGIIYISELTMALLDGSLVYVSKRAQNRTSDWSGTSLLEPRESHVNNMEESLELAATQQEMEPLPMNKFWSAYTYHRVFA
jgi:hypothetical protein